MDHTLTKIGKFLDATAQRDAVHFAVAPVIAAESLRPGDRIGFVEEGNREKVGKVSGTMKVVGIVDPFLSYGPYPGARFFMFLLPGTITSLRHDWTHPAFASPTEPPPPADKEASRRWIEEFADELDQTYNRLMDAAHRWVQCGDYTYDNSEAYKNTRLRAKWPIFWHHYEIVTGEKVEDHEDTFFTCSC